MHLARSESPLGVGPASTRSSVSSPESGQWNLAARERTVVSAYFRPATAFQLSAQLTFDLLMLVVFLSQASLGVVTAERTDRLAEARIRRRDSSTPSDCVFRHSILVACDRLVARSKQRERVFWIGGAQSPVPQGWRPSGERGQLPARQQGEHPPRGKQRDDQCPRERQASADHFQHLPASDATTAHCPVDAEACQTNRQYR